MAEETVTTGRNEPCPCGSGKKFKRCCGINSAPKLTQPKTPPQPMEDRYAEVAKRAGVEGFDPSQFNPEMMAQFTKAFQRLPAAQRQRLQSIMMRAMSGQDVSRDAEIFERSLPPELRSMLQGLQPSGAGGGVAGIETSEASVEPSAASQEKDSADMLVADARQIIEEAVASGKISKDEAEKLLQNQIDTSSNLSDTPELPKKKGTFGQLWKKLGGNRKD